MKPGQDSETTQGPGNGENDNLDAVCGGMKSGGKLSKVVWVATGTLEEDIEAKGGSVVGGHEEPAAGIGTGGGRGMGGRAGGKLLV